MQPQALNVHLFYNSKPRSALVFLQNRPCGRLEKPTYNTFLRPVLTEILSSKKSKVLYKLKAIHRNTPGRYAGGQRYTP